ncbi:MAG TPA: hypothetical protein VHR64_08250 [Thermomicrobiales bacterium]|jgi:hypothetical protein|nr:hypothetical protein [Thermomicrobiales bacterium]
MGKQVTPEVIRATAQMIGLELGDDEIAPVSERLQLLLDAADQFNHLTENTAELDVRFNAAWEVEQV